MSETTPPPGGEADEWAAVDATALVLAKLEWADDNRELPTVHRLPWADASERARAPYLDKGRTRASVLYGARLLNPDWRPGVLELEVSGDGDTGI